MSHKRSLNVAPNQIKFVKSALRRNSCPSQKALAEELGLARSTVSHFFNGIAIDRLNFIEICHSLGLDWKGISQTETTPVEENSYYVKRSVLESLCYETLVQPGALIRIKAPKKMGKTTLMNWLLQEAEKQGYRTADVNLLDADEVSLSNLDLFLRWFCGCIGRQLEIRREVLHELWDEEDGSKVNCNTYFEDCLLSESDQALTLCIDQIDRVFPYPIAEDFLGLLRSWHEKAKRSYLWKKLRLVVVHSTEVYIPLDVNKSPFNVGEPIELSEFTTQQVEELTQQYQLTLSPQQIQGLIDWVGGHPFLIDRALSILKNLPDLTLEQLLEKAPTLEGIYRSHLQELWSDLQEHPELITALKQVVNADHSVCLEPMLTYKLYSLGLVKLAGNDIIPRCQLYRVYFRDRLGTI
jgi:serine/threonine-protein kinase